MNANHLLIINYLTEFIVLEEWKKFAVLINGIFTSYQEHFLKIFA